MKTPAARARCEKDRWRATVGGDRPWRMRAGDRCRLDMLSAPKPCIRARAIAHRYYVTAGYNRMWHLHHEEPGARETSGSFRSEHLTALSRGNRNEHVSRPVSDTSSNSTARDGDAARRETRRRMYRERGASSAGKHV